MKYWILIFTLACSNSVYALQKYCSKKEQVALFNQLGIKLIDKNIYEKNIIGVLKQNALKSNVFSEYRQNITKRYALALKKGVFPDLCIKNVSKQVGRGLFANEFIKKGQLVGEYLGVVKYAQSVVNTDYVFNYPLKFNGKDLSLDALKFGNSLRFANHSDNPNLQTGYISVDGVFRLIFFAKKNIKAGEQVFIDYGKSYWTPLNGKKVRTKQKLS